MMTSATVDLTFKLSGPAFGICTYIEALGALGIVAMMSSSLFVVSDKTDERTPVTR